MVAKTERFSFSQNAKFNKQGQKMRDDDMLILRGGKIQSLLEGHEHEIIDRVQ